MTNLLVMLMTLLSVVLFLLGVYTGIYLARNSREIITRDVERLIPTERVVEIEKPVVVQVPSYQKPRNPGGLVNMNQPNKNVITDPVKRAETERMSDLLNSLPEV